MNDQDLPDTIGGALALACARYAGRPFLAVPASDKRDYDCGGRSLTYAQVAQEVSFLAAHYRRQGYGVGHRVGLLLENRLEHVLHKFALNSTGACVVPVNPDYTAREFAHIIDHAGLDACVCLSGRRADWDAALQVSTGSPAYIALETFPHSLEPALEPATNFSPTASSAATVLYTSGTTGKPKGCVLSHGYELASGRAYLDRRGMATFREEGERIYNPLPLHHVNASVLSLFAALLSGSCQIQADRFHPTRWWKEVVNSGATVVHYLGVMVQMLLSLDRTDLEKMHGVRFGIGAGIEPQVHSVCERRFGFPFLEIWGMTEMVRILVDCSPPRDVGTRAFGREVAGLQVRVVDDKNEDVPVGAVGEMIIRHSAQTPRKDFFSGYLDDEEATETAWRDGWFHTGDLVTRDATGMLHFVERRKNIIRRAGENIAAAEVEAWLMTHPRVKMAAVLAVADEVREEEVLACIVLDGPLPLESSRCDEEALVQGIHAHCSEGLAYYKTPGWMLVVDHLPTTGTQKVQKHALFQHGTDPRSVEGIHDLRALKKRPPSGIGTPPI